jgi:hypothetical protein
MKSKLSVKQQGVRGGNPIWKENTGRVSLFIDSSDNVINVDAFSGFGDEYTRRDECFVILRFEGKNVFSGTFSDLVNKLNS